MALWRQDMGFFVIDIVHVVCFQFRDNNGCSKWHRNKWTKIELFWTEVSLKLELKINPHLEMQIIFLWQRLVYTTMWVWWTVTYIPRIFWFHNTSRYSPLVLLNCHGNKATSWGNMVHKLLFPSLLTIVCCVLLKQNFQFNNDDNVSIKIYHQITECQRRLILEHIINVSILI